MLSALLSLPGLYHVLAFLLGRRVIIQGRSMFPALSPGEYVLFDRLAYRRQPPRRGDIVLASHPTRPGLRIVKRVAAEPGDRVAMDGERVWVNGEPYGEGEGEPPPSAAERTLGDDEWLLLGDATDRSTDAREFGPVSRERLLGRAWLVYWPPNRIRRLRHDLPP